MKKNNTVHASSNVSKAVLDVGIYTRQCINELPEKDHDVAWASIGAAIAAAGIHDSNEPEKVADMIAAAITAMLHVRRTKMSKIVKLHKKNQKNKKPKLKWWEKEAFECDALRASIGAQAGDGLKILERMRQGNEMQKALAKCYNNMSANAADALVSMYASNPTLALLMKKAEQAHFGIVVDNTKNEKP